MNFDVVNYSFLLQDFIFAMGAGFAVGGINRFLSLFLYKGKIRLWIKDMLVAFLFAVAVFSYVVSFANYPDVRIYHLLGALFGFLCSRHGGAPPDSTGPGGEFPACPGLAGRPFQAR